MQGKVKCADCGFLAVRHRDTRELTDAEEPLRTTGEIPADHRGLIYVEWPICFIRRIDFRKELNDNSGTPHRKRVLNEERECDNGFTPWQQGLTPKEHQEMIQQKMLLDWQREQADEQRRFQAEQARLADERHFQQLELANKHHRENLELVAATTQKNVTAVYWGAGIAAVATLIGGGLGAALLALGGG